MKRVINSIIFFITVCACVAQTPQGMNYQAVARNSNGAVLQNQNIGIRFTLHDASAIGTAVYIETQAATTNQFGIFTARVGMGTATQGTFSTINWGSADKYLEVEIDAAGGSNYVSMGSTQLLSVPYALYATPPGHYSAKYTGAIAYTPSNNVQVTYDSIRYNNGFGSLDKATFTIPETGIYHVNVTLDMDYSMVDIGKLSDIKLSLVKSTGEIIQRDHKIISQGVYSYSTGYNLAISTDVELQQGENLATQFMAQLYGSSPIAFGLFTNLTFSIHKIY